MYFVKANLAQNGSAKSRFSHAAFRCECDSWASRASAAVYGERSVWNLPFLPANPVAATPHGIRCYNGSRRTVPARQAQALAARAFNTMTGRSIDETH